MTAKRKTERELTRVELRDIRKLETGLLPKQQALILKVLVKAGTKGLTKAEFAATLGKTVDQIAGLSFNRNCRLLIAAGLMPEREHDGKEYRYYASDDKRFASAVDSVESFVGIGNARDVSSDAFAYSAANYEIDTVKRSTLLSKSSIDVATAKLNAKSVSLKPAVKQSLNTRAKKAKTAV